MTEITSLHEAEDLALEDKTIVKQGVFDRKVSLTEATAQGWAKVYGYSYKGQHSTSKQFVTYKDFTLYLGQAYFVDSGVILPYTSSNSDPTLDLNMKSIYDLRGSITPVTASNIGTGEGIFSSKAGEDLQFKSLKAVGATISSDSDSVTVTVSGGTGDMSKNIYDPTNIEADTFARSNHTGVQAISTVSGLQTSLDSKVDEVVGKQLSDENYTLGEKNKLAGLDDTTYWKGDYLTVADLELAHPTSNAGSYAFVDAGVGVDVVKYIWDSSDSKWVSTGGSGGTETPATIKTKYESNADTNAFTDNDALEVAKIIDKVDKVAGKELSENDFTDADKALVNTITTKKSTTNKTTSASGDLPAWAVWLADTSTVLTRPMNPTPTDGEECTVVDSTDNALINNITLTVTAPTTITSGVLNENGQANKYRYDATGDVWDLVFRQASATGGGDYIVETKILYISDGLISETDTGAKLSKNRREVVDIATYLGSDWVGEYLWVETEVYNDTGVGVAGWGDPEWMYTASPCGIRCNMLGDSLVVQSGRDLTLGRSISQGHPFNLTGSTSIISSKTRITVTRLTYNNDAIFGNLVDVHVIDAGTVSNNNRYVFDIATEMGADWVGKDLLIQTEVQYNGEWGDPEWIYTSGGRGVKTNQFNSDKVVVQTGSSVVLNAEGSTGGHPFGSAANSSSIPCRAICYKFTDDAIAAGVVGSTTVDLGTISFNTRTVTSTASIGADYVGKNLVTLNQIQYNSDWGNPEWIYSSVGSGVRSNVLGDDVITQTGSSNLLSTSSNQGNPFGSTGNPTSTPSRIKVWRLG